MIYEVISDISKFDFEKEVALKINQGYQLVGNLQITVHNGILNYTREVVKP